MTCNRWVHVAYRTLLLHYLLVLAFRTRGAFGAFELLSGTKFRHLRERRVEASEVVIMLAGCAEDHAMLVSGLNECKIVSGSEVS